jgi:FkbM family methyltransferase
MKKQIKRAIKAICPPVAWDAATRLAAKLIPRHEAECDQRVAVMKASFDQINRDLPLGEIALRRDLRLRVHPHSIEAFEHFCYRSPDMVHELDAFLAASASSRSLLDIGALHGIFSLAFAVKDSSRRALAIDASPLAFAKLLYNIHANTATNIEPIECAVTAASGTLPMHYEWEHAMAAGASEREESFQAPASTGDAICDARGFLPDIVKIDVEGHEVKVLRGLAATLERCRPQVFLELHPWLMRAEGDSLDDISDIFRRLSYRAATVDGQCVELAALGKITDCERIMLTPLMS